jgi:hypothetical protein
VSLEENNKALVHCFLEEQAKGNFDIIDELVASDFVDLSLMPGQEPDREGYKRSVAEIKYRQDIIAICLRHDTSDWNQNKTLDCERSNRTPT